MISVNIHDSKTHLSKLLARVATGEEVVISKAGHPLAKLTKIETPQRKRVGGFDRGLVKLSDDFDNEDPKIKRMFKL